MMCALGRPHAVSAAQHGRSSLLASLTRMLAAEHLNVGQTCGS
jgi:hypothetical protein